MFVGPVRKAHCWFSHDTALMLFLSFQVIERIEKRTCSGCPVSNLVDGVINWRVITSDFCGSDIIPHLTTITNELIINFVSDGRVSYRGFAIPFAPMESKYRSHSI